MYLGLWFYTNACTLYVYFIHACACIKYMYSVCSMCACYLMFSVYLSLCIVVTLCSTWVRLLKMMMIILRLNQLVSYSFGLIWRDYTLSLPFPFLLLSFIVNLLYFSLSPLSFFAAVVFPLSSIHLQAISSTLAHKLHVERESHRFLARRR